MREARTRAGPDDCTDGGRGSSRAAPGPRGSAAPPGRAGPRFVGGRAVQRPDGTTYEFATHGRSISPDERRIYAGVNAAKGGDHNRDFKSGSISAERLGPEAGGIYILDNSDIAAGKPGPQPPVVGPAEHGGGHAAVPGRQGGGATGAASMRGEVRGKAQGPLKTKAQGDLHTWS